MKRIMFVTLRKQLAQDMDVAYLIGDEGYDAAYDLKVVNSLDDLEQVISSWNPDLVVLSFDALSSRPSWDDLEAETAYHAIDEEELRNGASYALPAYGPSDTATKILDQLKKDPVPVRSLYASQQKTQKSDQRKPDSDRRTKSKPASFSGENRKAKDKKPARREAPKKTSRADDSSDQSGGLEELDGFETDFDLNGFEIGDEDDFNEPDDDEEDGYAEPEEEEPEEEEPEEDLYEEEEDEDDYPEEESEPEPEPEPKPKPAQQRKGAKRRISSPDTKVKEHDHEPKEERDAIDDALQNDVRGGDSKTQVVTVYSAKGGVGKTTIATELALYLSLVSIGKRNLRVCLVDYNIDFGDVRGTLALKEEGPNLTYWAGEVQEFLASGKKRREITYTQKEIEGWLRVYKDSGLYVLPAPLTNEDSMGIETDALEIILDNIIRHGNFDFVICDTGNNTRDSTMVALERATTILMIMTQNVNTAFCDRAFMRTMQSIDFDLSKTKLIINYIMPQKSTGITVQEIIDYFPYECIGKIRFNTDIIAATNLGKPLTVFHPENDFVTQMRGVVTALLKNSDFQTGTKPQKKKFSLFRKRR